MEIMIIDDDEDIREVIGIVLGAKGYHVVTVADGIDALRMLRAGSHPSMIFLDMMMPRLDGETFIKIMQQDPRLSTIPVVIMSGHRAARQKAQELHAAACLVKPVELEELLKTVQRVDANSAAHP